MLAITDSTDAVCPVVQEFELLPANVYDSLVNGTANLAANAVAWAGTAITATSLPVATAAGTSGGLLTFGTGAGQINVEAPATLRQTSPRSSARRRRARRVTSGSTGAR